MSDPVAAGDTTPGAAAAGGTPPDPALAAAARPRITDEPGADEPGADEPGADEPPADKPPADKPPASARRADRIPALVQRSAVWFRHLPRGRRWLLVGALALVLIPLLVIADSYLIVRDVRPLAREAPRETRVMRDRRADGRTPGPLRQRWVNLGAMSPHLAHAVVVHEDATFFEHHGFDEFEIRAALRRSWAERRMVRGASTITTQLARNLYLGTGRSLIRKLREIPLTLRLERALSKRRILELYLNYAEWGPGVFGAEAASRYHFNTSARNLSPARAALLTAALPSPRRSTPARPSPYLSRRASIILTRMQARGWLTAAELQAARQELGLRGPAPSTVSPEELDAAREEGRAEAEAEAVIEGEDAETTPAHDGPAPIEPPAAAPAPAPPAGEQPAGEPLDLTPPEPAPAADSPAATPHG